MERILLYGVHAEKCDASHILYDEQLKHEKPHEMISQMILACLERAGDNLSVQQVEIFTNPAMATPTL